MMNKLEQLKKIITLRAERKAELKARLFQRIEAEIAVAERAQGAMAHTAKQSLWARMLRPAPAFAGFLALSLLGGGTVAAAEESRPGEALYPVKLNFNEKVAMAFALGDEARAEAEARFAERRITEASELAAEGKLDDAINARLEARFEKHADRVEARIEKMKEKGNEVKAAELASRFESSLRAHQAILARASAAGSSTAAIAKPLETKVEARMDAIANVRAKLEGGLRAEKIEGAAAQAAEYRVEAAGNLIIGVERFIERKKSELGSGVTVAAEAKLDEARASYADAQAYAEEDASLEAFKAAGRAMRTAQEARVLVKAGRPAINAAGRMPPVSAGVSGSAEMEAGDSDEAAAEAGIENRAKLDFDEKDIESNVDSLLRLGL